MSDGENTGHYTHSNPGYSGRYNSGQKISIHVITHARRRTHRNLQVHTEMKPPKKLVLLKFVLFIKANFC